MCLAAPRSRPRLRACATPASAFRPAARRAFVRSRSPLLRSKARGLPSVARPLGGRKIHRIFRTAPPRPISARGTRRPVASPSGRGASPSAAAAVAWRLDRGTVFPSSSPVSGRGDLRSFRAEGRREYPPLRRCAPMSAQSDLRSARCEPEWGRHTEVPPARRGRGEPGQWRASSECSPRRTGAPRTVRPGLSSAAGKAERRKTEALAPAGAGGKGAAPERRGDSGARRNASDGEDRGQLLMPASSSMAGAARALRRGGPVRTVSRA